MLPIDVQFGVRTPDIVASTSNGYIQKLQKRLDWAYKTAHEVSKKESECSKRRYDWNVKCTKLEPGDLVLVRQKAFKGKHMKSADRWENTPYHVIQCIGGHLPVYKVQLVDDTTKFRILHRNLLFPLAMRNESDEKQVMEINKPNLAGSENNTSSGQINNYERPVTRSKTKGIKYTLLLKANMLMSNHFYDE